MSLQRPVRPPLDGSLIVLPGFVDFHATHNPDLPFFVFPDGGSCTFREFADATHRIAHILRPDRLGPDRQIVAVVIHCDTALYHATTVGAVRAGLIPFVMSPRNSATAIAKMLQGTNCHRLIHHAPFHSLTEAVRAILPEGYTLQTDDLVSLGDAFPRYGEGLPGLPVLPYPLPKEPIDNDDVMLYLHSSGSTGFPKPIPQSVLAVLHWSTSSQTTSTIKHGLCWGSPALPPFHTMGVLFQLYIPLASGLPCTLYSPREHLNMPPPMPTAQNVLEACQQTKATAVVTVPSFIEEWAQDRQATDYLATVDLLLFAGGPLSKSNGDKLSEAGVKLYAAYGGTEFGPGTRILDSIEDSPDDPDVVKVGKTRKDWEWMSFPKSINIRWEPQDDGTFELVFLSSPTHCLSVLNLTGGERGYATSDLWKRHPTKDLWRITGRTDDVIVLGNGEKIVPISQEGHVTAHPMVMGAVMFGRGKEQPGIIVEPRPQYAIRPGDEEALVNFRNAIWPQMEEANEIAPAWGRIFKEMILVSDPDRPLPRASKGTVQRKLAIALYEEDIEKLYETIANSADAGGVAPPSNWSQLEVQAWLSEHVAQFNHGVALPLTADLFAHGFDSLSATFLRNRIIGTLRSSHDNAAQAAVQHVSSSFIFKHPTIGEIAAALTSFVHLGSDATPLVQDPIVQIEAMIAKYTSQLPDAAAASTKNADGAVVFVTGTVGALGAHLIAQLLVNSHVRKVYALNRGTKVAERQRLAFENALLPINLLSDPKLTLLEGDIMREDIGLEAEVLQEVRSTVTDIIQNAWRVDFNLSLASFEPYVAASVRLVKLVPNARFFFTSSIAAVSGWAISKNGPVPEEPVHDHAVAAGLGYGASKYVIEEVLANARGRGLAATTFRIGQIAGSSASGAWNINEWVPSLVKSSISLGCLPQLQGEAAWVPMDAVARSISDIVLGDETPSCVNIVHPRPIAASEVIGELNTALGLGLPLVPTAQWVQHLENAAKNPSAKDLDAVPAIKLLDFFRTFVAAHSTDGTQIFQTQKAQALSPTMANLSPLGKIEISAWVAYWRSKKFLP